MGKKLQNLFIPKEYTYTGTIHFKNQEAYSEFAKKLDCMYKTGEPQNIQTEYELRMNENINGLSYEILNEKNGVDLYVALPKEKIKIPVKVDGVEDNITLYRTVANNIVKTRTSENAIVKFEFVWEKEKGNTKFSCKTQEEKAGNIEEIIYEYRKVIDLFGTIFITVPDQIDLIIKDLEKSIKYLIMLTEVSKVLEIEIDMKNLKEINDVRLETLYLLLVKKAKIKGSFNIDSFNNVEEGEFNIGQKLLVHSIIKRDIMILGCKKSLYQVICGFDLLISDIVVLDDGNKKIMFKPIEGKDSITSYSGFIDKLEANEEIDRLNMGLKASKDDVTESGIWYEYKNAKRVDLLVDELYC